MKKFIKKATAFLLIMAMFLSISGCSGGDDNTGNSVNTGEIQNFTDDSGRTMELPRQINKIVPSGSLAQIVLTAIAPDMFAGVASAVPQQHKEIMPEELFGLTEFGSLYSGGDLNVEELALAAPDVIIDIGDSKKGVAEDMDRLQTQTNIPSVFIYSTLETMPQTYRTLGRLLGREERGEELAQFCEKVYNRTLAVMDKVGDNKIKSLYVLGDKGLNVIAADSYHSELLDLLTDNLAVVDNPVSKGFGNEVSMEQISLWNPDFVIFRPDSIYSTVKNIPAWNEITAIKSNSYIQVPDAPYNWMSMPPSVQRYLGLIWLPAQLYPEYCEYDVKADIKEYYRLFYGCSLTDEQYNIITENAFIN